MFNGRDGMCNFSHLGRVFVLAVFFSVVLSHAWCVPDVKIFNGSQIGVVSCYEGSACSEDSPYPSCGSTRACDASLCTSSLYQNGNYYGGVDNGSYGVCSGNYCQGLLHTSYALCRYTIRCGTEREADSVTCKTQGYVWEDGECKAPCDAECQCEEDGGTWDGENCNYEDLCAADRASCERAGGKWSGTELGRECCASSCNLCDVSASQYIYFLKKRECCSKSQAPPDPNSTCYVPVQSGCGMTTSQWVDQNTNDWDCEDPNNDSVSRARFYEMCFGEESSSSTVLDDESSSSLACEGDTCSSSSVGDSTSSSSSSEGGSGGSSGSQGGTSSGSQSGDSSGSGSGGSSGSGSGGSSGSGSGGTGGDGSGGEGGSGSGGEGEGEICPECSLLSSILGVLGEIGQDVSGILTCLQIPHLCPALDDDFSPVIQAMGDASDSSSKYLSQIADLIGVSTESLNSHLDSILRHIPDTVLDSMLKYQKRIEANFDSVMYGMGQGFGKVDSLIDSAVKYFQISNTYDSMYRVMFSSFDSSFNSNMNDLPGRNASAIGSMLGYGDTASSTLRGDLQGIRNGIDSLVNLWGDTSGLGGGNGYGDSLGRYRDSINKYYISDGRFGELVDSTEAAWGVDSLDARWDSSFAYGLCDGVDCPPCSDDSCMGSLPANFVQRADSIARIAGDSLEASTKRQRDSLPTFWDSTFKELKEYSWFGSFDSTFLANIGAKIPNSNTCPDHCFAMDVNGTYAFVGYNMHLDWKLCRPVAPNVLNSLNAFDIIKLLARILTVVTCLSILMWEVSSRRGGGIGL